MGMEGRICRGGRPCSTGGRAESADFLMVSLCRCAARKSPARNLEMEWELRRRGRPEAEARRAWPSTRPRFSSRTWTISDACVPLNRRSAFVNVQQPADVSSAGELGTRDIQITQRSERFGFGLTRRVTPISSASTVSAVATLCRRSRGGRVLPRPSFAVLPGLSHMALLKASTQVAAASRAAQAT